MDQDGDVIDILVQPPRNQRAAERFFRRLIKGQGGESRWLVTDKLRSYDAAHRLFEKRFILVKKVSGPSTLSLTEEESKHSCLRNFRVLLRRVAQTGIPRKLKS